MMKKKTLFESAITRIATTARVLSISVQGFFV